MKIKQVLLSCLLVFVYTNIQAQTFSTPITQMETLTRGLVALPASDGKGEFISWRLFGTDTANTTFDLLRDGNVIASDLKDVTNYTDVNGNTSSKYRILTKVNGNISETSDDVLPWTNVFKSITLDRPASGVTPAYTCSRNKVTYNYPNGESYSYSPNDCSVADVDGDGEYELIVKWDPTNSQDNSLEGITGNVYLDCYKLDGSKLWRIDMGANIRAGAHYTQFLVFDFNGDGKAEVICKTAPGTIDGVGNYVTVAADDATIKAADNTKIYRTSVGLILNGPEYLTVFNGETGAAINTINYTPSRGITTNDPSTSTLKSIWGDNYGNRADRFLACVAYLDGADKKPSAVMCRGYYTRSYLWAVDFNGNKLSTKWLHASTSTSEYSVADATGTSIKYSGSISTYTKKTGTAYGQGAHSIAVADVDNDGCDEIIYGSAAINNDGTLLYTTGLGHGDAQHLCDINPDREGLEYFMVHEDSPYGIDVHDAKTGEILVHANGSGDTGRGMAADIDSNHRGCEIWSSDTSGNNSYTLDYSGATIVQKKATYDFRIYWDGDVQEELLNAKNNAPYLEKWNGTKANNLLINNQNVSYYGNSTSCNSTKGTPNLTADLFGDWREEMIFWNNKDSASINIFTTNVASSYRVPTLMHDHVYRMGVAWQNVAYNQPPHLGYYLPDYVLTATGLNNTTDDLVYDTGMVKSVYTIRGEYRGDSVKDLPCGLYIEKLQYGDKILTRKIINR